MQPPPTTPGAGPPHVLHRGDPVELFFRKFDGTDHWRYRCDYLGADEFGDWIGGGAGTVIARPGKRFVWDGDFAVLLPRDRHHVVTVNGPTRLTRNEIYVDITTIPQWTAPAATDPAELRGRVVAVDLDLDVVRRFGATEAFVEDEDEFAEHRAAMGYPDDLAGTAEREATWVAARISAGDEPFGSVAAAWLAGLPGTRTS